MLYFAFFCLFRRSFFVKNLANVPEKPATKISSGTRLPKVRSRFCAPIAKVSVKAKTASKRWKSSSKCYLYITFYNISYPFLKWKRLQQSSTLFFFSSFFATSANNCTFAVEFSAMTRQMPIYE